MIAKNMPEDRKCKNVRNKFKNKKKRDNPDNRQ